MCSRHESQAGLCAQALSLDCVPSLVALLANDAGAVVEEAAAALANFAALAEAIGAAEARAVAEARRRAGKGPGVPRPEPDVKVGGGWQWQPAVWRANVALVVCLHSHRPAHPPTCLPTNANGYCQACTAV